MIATVLLDTNVFTAWLKPRSPLVEQYGRYVYGRRLAVSQQTVAEARYGVIVAGWGAKRVDQLERLIRRSRPLPVDDDTVWSYARLRAKCRQLGHPLHQKEHSGDLWIAATAVRWRLPLIAHDAGIMVKAKTVGELARRIGVDPARLRAMVDRFNGFARSGVDGDFGRGNSAYDRYYGDPTVRPNPCLGPLEKGPFTAFKVVIGDLGTKGGVVTDADARALREDGTVIEGLYSAGNNSASVMGRTYPGPGSTVGAATVFGLRAADTWPARTPDTERSRRTGTA